MTENIYAPQEAVIKEIVEENSSIKTYVMEFSDPDYNAGFSFKPGQFVMLSVADHGEAPISISSAPTRQDDFHLSVRKAGSLTSALHDMKAGDLLGVRGPYGRPFPMEDIRNCPLLFVAGGIGLAPLRSVINFCLDIREDYGPITILYGSRTPYDIAFSADLDKWAASLSVDLRLTVDQSEAGWDGDVGVVTTLIDGLNLDTENCQALICGPPVMISATAAKLIKSGIDPDRIITTMERNMKCGVGLCGHCHIGGKLVCKHGPVFTVAELQNIEGAL